MAQESFQQAKSWFNGVRNKFNHRITMEGILKQARESFEYFLQSRTAFDVEKKISDKLLRDAYGIVLLTEVKIGVLAGAKIGTGIIIVRVGEEADKWSAPIAIATGGISVGLQAGVSKVDHIIILPSPNHVKSFLGKGQIQIKGNAEAALAKYGRDANIGVGLSDNGDAAPIMSYSFGVKGLYAGLSVNGAMLTPRNKCNEEFYGKAVTLSQIAAGEIDAPQMNEDYKTIIQLLDVATMIGNHTMTYKEVKGYDCNLWTEGIVQKSAYDNFDCKK